LSTREIRAAAEAHLVPMTEAELASDPQEPRRTVLHRGRYWREMFTGLFEPVHPMARLTAWEATRPSPRCWGYHAALTESSTAGANSSMPMHLLVDLEGFTIDSLSSNRRYDLRRSQRQVTVVQVVGAGPLESGGYEVFRSAQARTRNPYRTARSKGAFLAELEWYISRPSAVVLAGLVDDRIGGWVAGYAVDGTAYIEIVDLATEVLSTQMGTGLYFAFVEACRRSPGIREIANSPHIPEDAALTFFKRGIGFPVVHVPSKAWLLPVANTLVRWRKPLLHYRLTGRMSPKG
jgi:hypothetical protein